MYFMDLRVNQDYILNDQESSTYSNFSEPDVSTLCSEVFHSLKRQLTQVTGIFASTRYEGERNVPESTVVTHMTR